MNQNNPLEGFSREKALAFAQSDAGKKLLALLQQTKPQELQKVIDQATAGNFEEAKKGVSALLSDQRAKSLVEEMRE